MICQDCGIEAPTKYVSFYQNIGALVMRFTKNIDGYLCKSCIHKHFWQMSLITLAVGWLGIVSLIIAPFILLNNIIRYIFCLTMPAVPPGAMPPVLSDEAVDRISPHARTLFERVEQGEKMEVVTESIAQQAGVSPGQVVLYIRAVLDAQSQQQ